MTRPADSAQRALQEASRQAAQIRIELDDDYLRAIVLVEALPSNQSGTDKSWVWRLVAATRRHYRLPRHVK
ncbi:MAG: hypothetical protein ACT4QD_15560 [Acidobacteriota bacterium]